MRYHELDRWHIGPDERSVDHGWVYAFRAGMVCGAGGVVQADEDEDEVAVDCTSGPPRDHLVHGVSSQRDFRGPSLRQLFPRQRRSHPQRRQHQLSLTNAK